MSLSILCHPITQPACYLIACERGGLAGTGGCSWSFWVSEWVFFLFFLSFIIIFFSFFPLGFELPCSAFSLLLEVAAGQNLFKLTA